jgi:phosphopantetheine--protein transferase-like protein
VTASSAKRFSGCNIEAGGLALPRPGELHVHLCHRSAAAHSASLTRRILSLYAPLSATELRILRGPNGKPALHKPPCAIEFNLSASGEWYAVAVTDGASVGIDLEFCDRARRVMKLASRYFSTAEYAQLERSPVSQRVDLFYDYWTLKEAHIKAGGGSLAAQLESTEFLLHYRAPSERDVVRGHIVPSARRTAWYALLQPVEDYRLALCCIGPHDYSWSTRLFNLSSNTAGNQLVREFRAQSSSPVSVPNHPGLHDAASAA